MAGSLVIRKRQDGSTTIESVLPDEHEFSARFIEREIPTGLVEVEIRIKASDGDVVYKLEGFGELETEGEDETRPNFVAWRCVRADAGKKKKARRG